MSGTDIKNTFLNCLAEGIESTSVSDALFKEVDSVIGDSLVFKSGLTGAALRSGEKLSAQKACAFASNSTDAAALHSLASSEKRVTVLRLIAANPNITTDTAETLRLKGHSLGDTEIFDALVVNTSKDLDNFFYSLFRSEENCNALWNSYLSKDSRAVTPTTSIGIARSFRASPSFSEAELEALRCTPSSLVVQVLIGYYVAGLLDNASEINVREMVESFGSDLSVRTGSNFCPPKGYETVDSDSIQRLVTLEKLLRQQNSTILGSTSAMRRFGYAGRVRTMDFAVAEDFTITSEALQYGVAYVDSVFTADQGAALDMLQFLTAASYSDSADQKLLLETLVKHASAIAAGLDSRAVGERLLGRFAHQHHFNIFDFSEAVRMLVAEVEQGKFPVEYLESFLGVFGRGRFRELVGIYALDFLPDDVFRVVISSPACQAYRKSFLGLSSDLVDKPFPLMPTRRHFEIYSEEAAKAGNEDMVKDAYDWFQTFPLEESNGNPSPREQALSDLVECVLDCTNSVSSAIPNPFASSYSRPGRALAKAIAHTANRYFGDSVEMWQAFVAMADTIHEQPVSQLMNGIRILYGLDPLASPFSEEEEIPVEDPEFEVPTVTVPAVQMNLFS